ncbi:hypothetical protein [Pseudomonas chlororaphis]|uniref:hypothetical protein n=1 Tax=Pseudomonas chlororaphis TaxID=587753 RepID=UPI0004B6D9AD|nr:hypothetical protein [Pseudomonas chlororaphis]
MPSAERSGVFDISDADGVNESERLLMRLCRRSFLSLWAHANLHTDQDMRDGKGSAKEFADVLVVFGNDIVIFSDKHIAYQTEVDASIAWKRWYKRAVSNSAKQLYGAKSWLERFPSRVFLDSKCTRAIPVGIPDVSTARFHLIAITRGSAEACEKHYPGSRGSHMINTVVDHGAYPDMPFTTGPLDPNKEFVHVFDELSLEVLMSEMSTIADFIDYIVARKKLLLSRETMVVSAGEEQLIAAFLTHSGEDDINSFLPRGEQAPGIVTFDETLYPALLARPEYKAMHAENEKSHFWDYLIEKFINIGDPSLIDLGLSPENHDTERALRAMASESRFMRRELVANIFELMERARYESPSRRARTLTTKQSPDILYIFLLCSKLADQTYEEYRKLRAGMLYAYAQCAKLKFEKAVTIIALGFDHPNKTYSGGSEDLCVFICDEYSQEERARVEDLRERLGIYADTLKFNESQRFQFPVVPENTSSGARSMVEDQKKNKNKQKKAQNKRQKQSRKKNRVR